MHGPTRVMQVVPRPHQSRHPDRPVSMAPCTISLLQAQLAACAFARQGSRVHRTAAAVHACRHCRNPDGSAAKRHISRFPHPPAFTVGRVPMFITILYTPPSSAGHPCGACSCAHPKYTPCCRCPSCCATAAGSMLAVGTPSWRLPRPKPRTTGPEAHRGAPCRR